MSNAQWQRIVTSQRREKLHAYWEELTPDLREALSRDGSVAQILKELDPAKKLAKVAKPKPSRATQPKLRTLRAMGFEDERAMIDALEQSDGDVRAPASVQGLLSCPPHLPPTISPEVP